MKKILLSTLSILAISLCSCSFGSEKGVIGKSFVYSECTSTEVKQGSETNFYVEGNGAGSDKETAIKSIVNALYHHGTDSKTGVLEFSNHKHTGFKYNGTETVIYAYNEVEYDEETSYVQYTDNGYYMALNDDWTSIKFVTDSDDGLVDQEFDFTGYSGTRGYGDNRTKYSYRTSAKETEMNYDADSKTLAITMEVTFVSTVNSVTDTNVIDYALTFAEQ